MNYRKLTGNTWVVYALAFLASMTNALQARINGATSEQIGNPVVAAMMSVGGGFVVATCLVLSSGGLRNRLRNLIRQKGSPELSFWHFLAGFGGGIFIFGQTLVVPVFGVAIYIISVVAGQTIASLVVDHLGIGPAGKRKITPLRLIAAFLATLGVVVSVVGKTEVSSLAIPAILFGFAAGAGTAVQYALNGRIAKAFGSTLLTSSLNFFMGFSLLSALLFTGTIFGVWQLAAPPSILEQPHLWLGGVLGLIFIASAAFFVGRLGVLIFAVISVLGQLVGALLLDVFAPNRGSEVTIYVISGLLLTTVGVMLASTKSRDESV